MTSTLWDRYYFTVERNGACLTDEHCKRAYSLTRIWGHDYIKLVREDSLSLLNTVSFNNSDPTFIS